MTLNGTKRKVGKEKRGEIISVFSYMLQCKNYFNLKRAKHSSIFVLRRKGKNEAKRNFCNLKQSKKLPFFDTKHVKLFCLNQYSERKQKWSEFDFMREPIFCVKNVLYINNSLQLSVQRKKLST
jgi:hypothetical protein